MELTQKISITLDPGHGQYGNKSPNNPKYYEGTQMWHLSVKLKAALEKYGFEVHTTRPNLEDSPALDKRGTSAGKNGSSLFLSLHSNAPGKKADGSYDAVTTGTSVYYSLTKPETKNFASTLGNKVAELMGHHYRGSKTKQYPNKPNVDYYSVIRNAVESGCPCALLVEHGFHTNLKDSEFLLKDENLQKLADVEAAIIAEYFGVAKVAPAKTRYFVQVGIFENVEAAADTLIRAKAAGFDARIVDSEGEPVEPVSPEIILKVGDKVKMEKNAPVYGKTKKYNFWVYNTTLYVREVAGDRIVVSTKKTGAVTGAVHKKYLTLV